jgi:poly(A) polymerase Pap1
MLLFYFDNNDRYDLPDEVFGEDEKRPERPIKKRKRKVADGVSFCYHHLYK